MRHLQSTFLASVLYLLCASTNATVIEYEATSLGGNTWEYVYTVENDSLAVDIENFAVFFDLGLYENLAVGSSTPADWDPLVLQPDPLLPDDGLYDALALVVGIAPGDSLGGFAVQFDFLGSSAPGDQFFEVFDVNFNVLDSGFTEEAETDTTDPSVPSPGTLLLIALGLLGLRTVRRS